MLSINTNLSSLIVQSNLKLSTSGLNTAIERMTTGFKINRAKDNAANYAINTKLSSKISAYQIAEENAMMGVSMLDTAFQSLDIINNHLSRLQFLCIQARNETYGSSSQTAIKKEAGELIQEINRIYANTEYNGISLLNASGSFIKEVAVRETSSITPLAIMDNNVEITDGIYSISSASELAKLSLMTNNGKIQGGEFVLASNIDLSQYASWIPIGNDAASAFNASFDGNGYVIQNLEINSTGTDNQGLFGFVNGNISNLGIKDGDVTAGQNSGILAAQVSNGNIMNCYAIGNVNGENNLGGLIGVFNNGSISECYAISKVNGYDKIGGLIGSTCVGINNCYSISNVSGNNNVGGLIGDSYGVNSAINCYSKGDVRGANNIGGIYGNKGTGGEVINSFYEGNVYGSERVGGLIGNDIFNKVSNCYANVRVYGKNKTAGLSGNKWNGRIENSYVNLDSSSNINAIFVASVQGYTNVSDSYYNIEFDNKGIALTLGNAYTSNITAFSEPPFKLNSVMPVAAKNSVDFCIGINYDESSIVSMGTDFDITSELCSLLYTNFNNDDYLKSINSMIMKIRTKTTELGGVQNRLQSALEQITISYQNLVSTRSTIRDADIAEESSEYIRNQILQQAAATLMAAANQTPGIVLQLL